MTGSAAVGREDQWSDIDLAFFLLDSTLQIDLGFWPAAEFGAVAPEFRLLFGTVNERPTPRAPVDAELIGMGWLYALHARSSIARGRVWQAEYMINGVRTMFSLWPACVTVCLLFRAGAWTAFR